MRDATVAAAHSAEIASPVVPPSNLYPTREAWLAKAMTLLAEQVFEPAGYPVPKNVRVSCSWPSRGGAGRGRSVLGQTWHSSCSRDGFYEMFLSPRIDDPVQVLAVEGRELIHIAVGFEHGRLGPFKRCAETIGIHGRVIAPKVGAAFKRSIEPILAELGPYPHAALDPVKPKTEAKRTGFEPVTTGPKAQKGRLRKAECPAPDCGLIFRITSTWISGRTLCCPDKDCARHNLPMRIS